MHSSMHYFPPLPHGGAFLVAIAVTFGYHRAFGSYHTQEFAIGLCKAPSSDHSLLTFILPFKLIQMKLEALMSEVR